jgi:glycosyltransferase involved in cell wall biosynthesis
MDEIWVPSEFNRQTFAASGVQIGKIKVVPYAVDTNFFRPIGEQLQLSNLRRFKFLYVSFWDWRKGFDLLLEAYFSEFSSRDDVSLIIKTADPDCDLQESSIKIHDILMDSVARKVDLSRNDLPHLSVLTEQLTGHELRKLYNTCNLYISTDRANGWGMPCMEAMAMGKAAATIDWSGSTEFMKQGNSLLIRPTGRLIPVDERLAAARPMYEGHQWAEVTVKEVRQVMRFAYENPQKLKDIADGGMEYVRTTHSLAAVATKVQEQATQVELRLPRIRLQWKALRRGIKRQLLSIFK